jgi:hypothetical protein
MHGPLIVPGELATQAAAITLQAGSLYVVLARLLPPGLFGHGRAWLNAVVEVGSQPSFCSSAPIPQYPTSAGTVLLVTSPVSRSVMCF